MKNFNLSVCSLGLLASLPVLPLFIPWHLNPVASFHYEWLAIMLGLVAWILALPLLWRQQVLQIPRLALLPLLFMAFVGVQAQLLPLVIVQHAQMAMLYLLWAALLMVLVKLLTEQTDRQQISLWIAAGLVAAAVCASLLELFFRFKGAPEQWGGTLQYNNYADLLFLGLFSAWYLAAIKQVKLRTYLLIPAIIIVVALSLAPSRTVLLYWIAGLIIMRLLRRDTLKWLILGFGLYLLLQTVWTLEFNSHETAQNVMTNAGVPPKTAMESFYQKTGGTSLRLHIAKVAWHLFTQAPLLGHGFGQFDFAYFQAGQHIPELLINRMEHAHNLILHLLAELGFIPVLLLLIALGIWLKNIIAAVVKIRNNHDNIALTFYTWLLMLLAVLSIHSLLEYPLWYAQFLAITVILLTLGETQSWQLRLTSSVKTVVSLLLSVGIGIAGIHEWQYNKLENALTEYSASKNPQVFASLAQTAQQAPLLTPYIAIVLSFDADLDNENSRADLTALTNASYHFWPAPNLVYRQVKLQALSGFTDEARQTMKLALQAYPDSAKDFIKGLSVLNSHDQEKTKVLKQMAEEKIKSLKG